MATLRTLSFNFSNMFGWCSENFSLLNHLWWILPDEFLPGEFPSDFFLLNCYLSKVSLKYSLRFIQYALNDSNNDYALNYCNATSYYEIMLNTKWYDANHCLTIFLANLSKFRDLWLKPFQRIYTWHRNFLKVVFEDAKPLI